MTRVCSQCLATITGLEGCNQAHFDWENTHLVLEGKLAPAKRLHAPTLQRFKADPEAYGLIDTGNGIDS